MEPEGRHLRGEEGEKPVSLTLECQLVDPGKQAVSVHGRGCRVHSSSSIQFFRKTQNSLGHTFPELRPIPSPIFQPIVPLVMAPSHAPISQGSLSLGGSRGLHSYASKATSHQACCLLHSANLLIYMPGQKRIQRMRMPNAYSKPSSNFSPKKKSEGLFNAFQKLTTLLSLGLKDKIT